MLGRNRTEGRRIPHSPPVSNTVSYHASLFLRHSEPLPRWRQDSHICVSFRFLQSLRGTGSLRGPDERCCPAFKQSGVRDFSLEYTRCTMDVNASPASFSADLSGCDALAMLPAL